MELRNDGIREVGLFHTQARRRLETTRLNSVDQTSGAVFAQSSIQWTPQLRSVFGLRGDHYRFAVDGSRTRSDSLLSPKVSLIAGRWRDSEFYFNAGTGFHSNDARAGTSDLLVRTTAAEIGVRSKPTPRFYVSTSLWHLLLDSELVFVGDAGTTESTRPSRRYGVEVESWYQLSRWLMLDADLAWSHARFRDQDPAGSFIPGSIEAAASMGLSLVELNRWSGSVRYRHFGSRPLIEDDSVRSEPSNLVNARLSYRLTARARLDADLFNVLDSEASDIEYFYGSRLPGEPEEGIEDFHFHPVEPRSLRVSLAVAF
jgi:outer membrane receptor protein involved in Fe transport